MVNVCTLGLSFTANDERHHYDHTDPRARDHHSSQVIHSDASLGPEYLGGADGISFDSGLCGFLFRSDPRDQAKGTAVMGAIHLGHHQQVRDTTDPFFGSPIWQSL